MKTRLNLSNLLFCILKKNQSIIQSTKKCGIETERKTFGNIRYSCFNLFPIVSLLFVLSISNNFLHAQKIYWGYGLSFCLASNTKVDYNYLSESDNFFEPWRVKQDERFIANSKNIMRIDVAAGIQLKKTFLEVNVVPYYFRSFTFRAEGADYQGGPLVEKKIIYQFGATDINFKLKHVLTGRKNLRLAGVIGLSNMFLYDKRTEIGTSAVDFDLFDFKRKFYHLAMVGLEYIAYNGQDNIVLGLYYEHQLSAFSDKFTNGYLQASFKYLFYRNSKKRQVYVHD